MSTATIRPIHNQILCRRVEAPTQIGSILLPENAKSRQHSTKVSIVSVGPDVKAEDIVGKEGFIGHFAGADVEVDNDKFVLIKEDDLLAVLDD